MVTVFARSTAPTVMQETELGLLPADWRVTPLSELCEFKNGDRGFNYPSKRDFLRTGIPFVNAGHLQEGQIDFSEMDYISVEKFNSLGGGRFIRGDVLFCLRGSLGKFGIVEEATPTGTVASSLVIVRPDEKKIARGFLKAYFGSEFVLRMIALWAGGAAQPNLGAKDLARFVVALPPSRKEQEAIADALSNADVLIDSLEALIAKKRAIQQGAVQDLLSGRKRLPGFGRNWERRTFGEVFDFCPTATNSRADLSNDGDAFYVHYGDIHTRFHSHLNFAKQAVPRILRARCTNAATLRNGDWIMADASEDYDGVGKSIEVSGLDEGTVAVSGLHTFLLREKAKAFAPGFKGHLGNSGELRRQYLRVMTGMKVYGVSKTALRELVLPIPEWREQEAIRDILDDIDAELGTLEARLSKARQIKQGMMQELLTGRVRLV